MRMALRTVKAVLCLIVLRPLRQLLHSAKDDGVAWLSAIVALRHFWRISRRTYATPL
jgi:hypothetical protein